MIKYNPMSSPTITLLVVASALCLRLDGSKFNVVTLGKPDTQEPQLQLEVETGDAWRFKVGEVVEWGLYTSVPKADEASSPAEPPSQVAGEVIAGTAEDPSTTNEA